jgi:hypothetical protein
VFFFNHGEKAAPVEFSAVLDKPAAGIREITSGQSVPSEGKRFHVQTQVPAESVRIYRIDY